MTKTVESTVSTSVLYGVINCIMVIPVSISFCSIIYKDPAFAPYLPSLVKLVVFSSAVHQLAFTVLSSLPFAVGQVQDAGLIFLSAMASYIARHCEHAENIVPTTLFILSIYTALLGVVLIIVSKLKLASFVQYLPVPVIGGYLAYIGYFCATAGLEMMGGIQIENLQDYLLILEPAKFSLIAPGIVLGVGTYMLLQRGGASPYTLPMAMGFSLVLFYATMLATNTSFEEARLVGWIAPLTPMSKCFVHYILGLVFIGYYYYATNLTPPRLSPVCLGALRHHQGGVASVHQTASSLAGHVCRGCGLKVCMVYVYICICMCIYSDE